MLFNSLPFILFFSVVTALYFLLPHKWRWPLLLTASCFFYMFFKPVYILILAFTIVIDYYAGILIEQSHSPQQRKRWLILSIVANVGVLALFKYFNFFNANISGLAIALGYTNPIPYLKILLPIGLSFHTFQAMSYTIEVYRGHQKAERHFGIYALYVMFYPQLVAGPIERPQNMLHQFHEPKQFDYNNMVSGTRLMLWGLFKKTVIADRLAMVTDPVFDNPHGYTATSLAIAIVFFSFRIYCDFSGYSDIAIGSARTMGFKLMTNFDRPYAARSISDFWRRWHISLSTWFRDYVYIPLGGSRVRVRRMYLNLFIVFTLSGLWHGANRTFVVWGALNGLYLIVGAITAPYHQRLAAAVGLTRIPRLHRLWQQLQTFVLISLAWVFFRATSVHDALYIIKSTGRVFSELRWSMQAHLSAINLPVSGSKLMLCVAVILIMEAVQHLQGRGRIQSLLVSMPRPVRWGIYYAFIFIIIYAGIFQNRQFIYFQF